MTFLTRITAIFIFLIPTITLAESAQEKGRKIAEICDKAASGFGGEEASMTMEITSTGGSQSRELTTKTKERSGGDRMLLTVTSPADIKGTKLLTWSEKDSDDSQWLYMPAMKRVKRISAQLKSGSFMGSEFAYEDFSKKEVNKFKYKFIKDDKIDGKKVWVLERVSKDKNSGYSKEIMWIDSENKATLKDEYYDRKGDLFKVATMEGYRKVSGRWWRPKRVTMNNVQTNAKSVLNWKTLKLKVSISDSAFESENLKD